QRLIDGHLMGAERRSAAVVVPRVCGVELPIGLHDRVDRALHVPRRVPEVGVAAGLCAHEIADGDHVAAGYRVRVYQLGRPRVVAHAVHQRELGLGEGARVGWGGLVVVRVGGRVVDQARDLHAVAAELRGDAAPEVLGGHYAQAPVRCSGGGAAAGGQE